MSELGGAGRWVVVAALILACTLLAYQRSEAQPSTLYSYDAANHLIQATASTGSAVRYQYDASGHLTAVSALTPTLLNPNAQQNISIGASGQDALLTFNATAGESVTLNFGNISTTPANSVITVGVYDGSGSLVGSASSSSNPSLNLNNLAGGSYTVIVSPANSATGSLLASATVASDDSGPATDGPMPLWSYVVMAAMLLGIGWQRGRRLRS